AKFFPAVRKEIDWLPLKAFSNTVPAAVPSLFQIARPRVSSVATKIKVPFQFVMGPGLDAPRPGLMSFTSHVPPGVPSVRQSSLPLMPSSALKYVMLPICAPGNGMEDAEEAIVLMSFTLLAGCACAGCGEASNAAMASASERNHSFEGPKVRIFISLLL